MNHLVLDVITFTVALVLSVLAHPPFIRLLERLRAGQVIQAELPDQHQAKKGTPTGGGILFAVLGLLGGILATIAGHPGALPVLSGLFLGGLIGALDDLSKLRRGSIGIPARAKLPLQFLLAVPVAWFAWKAGACAQVPFSALLPGALYFPLALVAITGTANAVNFTDGIDGLAASVGIVVLVVLALLVPGAPAGERAAALSLAGALGGFLVFNRHPARLFMGDAGSLAVGYGLAAMALQQHIILLLPLLAGVFFLEAVSVIIQIGSFRLTGRRAFRMAPIHYTFQLAGWSENRITLSFAAATLAAALAAAWISWHAA